MIASLIAQEATASATAAPGYQRPSDWLAITDMSATEGFCGLHAVFDNDSNFCAFTCAGAYTVDWGDGSAAEAFASGATAYHNFAWADCSASTLTSRGYRQALVTVTPQSGQSLTSINLNQKHNQSGLVSGYTTHWLDIDLNGPNLTSLSISSGGGVVVRQLLLETANLRDIGSVTNLSYMFYYCPVFQKLEIGDTSSVTSLFKTFNITYALSVIPSMDLSSCTTIQSAFEVGGLHYLPADITFGNVNFTAAFRNNYTLQEIPAWDLSGVTTFNVAFSGCVSLARFRATGVSKSISFANCSLGADALDEIYGNLATVTGQTITVTGNYGTSGDDPTIATAKGWTVTG